MLAQRNQLDMLFKAPPPQTETKQIQPQSQQPHRQHQSALVVTTRPTHNKKIDIDLILSGDMDN